MRKGFIEARKDLDLGKIAATSTNRRARLRKGCARGKKELFLARI